jgi:plasmid stability protein
MTSITIRNLEAPLRRRLRARAVRHGWSIEEEVCQILRVALTEETWVPTNLFEAIRRHVDALGGIDLDIPPRGPPREPRFRP